MLQRFVAASTIASMAVALGGFALMLTPTARLQGAYLLTTVWCFVPLAWGIWALIAPSAWVPKRLPTWGLILGLLAGFLAAFVLNIPSRILGQTIPIMWRGVGVVVMAGFYYLLWMLVRITYRFLTPLADGPTSHWL